MATRKTEDTLILEEEFKDIVIERREEIGRVSLSPYGSEHYPVKVAFTVVADYLGEHLSGLQDSISLEFVAFGSRFNIGVSPESPNSR